MRKGFTLVRTLLRKNLASVQHGFTLVELLIVIALISSLAGLFVGGFRSSQAKGRDVKRKSDLKEIANALELLASDYHKYPDDSNGVIKACPFDPSGGTSTDCAWGVGSLTDGATIYLKTLPKDPDSNLSYFYRIVASSGNQKFQIFTHLENSKDKDCIGGDCASPAGISYFCGSSICNFAVTSSNTDYSE